MKILCAAVSLLLVLACPDLFAGGFQTRSELWRVVGGALKRFDKGPLPSAEVADIGQTVVGEGVGAIPILIDHLSDTKAATFRSAPLPGECYNRPVNAPAPHHCTEMQKESVPLGKLCSEWLYQIVTPAYSSPFARGRERGKAGMERPLEIKDWRAWLARHGRENLDELHAQARRLIDEFWRRGWEKGPVEWK